MGLNFRGSANRFKYKNQNSFQDKSAPGPRRGVGGDQPGSLARAEKRFARLRKQNEGAVSSTPITRKSSSPLKMNEALILGAADASKKFVDIGAAVAEGFKNANPEPKAADLKEEDKDKDPGVKDPNNDKDKDDTITTSSNPKVDAK